jgi:hypothetical protein
MLRLLDRWLGCDPDAIARYYRDEQLTVDLELHRARERGEMNNLERTVHAARSYFAA